MQNDFLSCVAWTYCKTSCIVYVFPQLGFDVLDYVMFTPDLL